MACVIEAVSRVEQIDEVLAIEEASFTNPWTREMYLAELRNPGVSYCFVARDESRRPAGFCSFWRVLDELHINNLAVAPEFRRSGGASTLLTFVLAEGVPMGAQRATLEVPRVNHPGPLPVTRTAVYGLPAPPAGLTPPR